MTENEQDLEQIEKMAGRSDVDNRTAEVLALCKIARQAGTIARELKRLADLYQFELGVDVVEPAEPDAREGLIDPGTDEGYDKCISAGGRAGAEWRELIRRTHDGRIEHLKGNPDAGIPGKLVPQDGLEE